MAENNMPDDLNTSSGWFFGKYGIRILRDYNNILNDAEAKDALVEKIFKEMNKDSNIDATITRVNAVLRIIKDNQFEFCLRYVANSEHIDKDAISSARDALTMIEYGMQKQRLLKQ